MSIVGVSYGEPAKTSQWVEKQSFQFEVWTDSDHKLSETFGAKGALPYPKRVTVILDSEANVVKRYSDVGPAAHPQEVLEDVAQLFPAQ